MTSYAKNLIYFHVLSDPWEGTIMIVQEKTEDHWEKSFNQIIFVVGCMYMQHHIIIYFCFYIEAGAYIYVLYQ